MKRRGFTLVEMLVVLAVVSLLAAVLLPVLSAARAKARQTVCLSNLRQLGTAVILYAQDYDDVFPRGADPSDRYSGPEEFKTFPLLTTVLDPYLMSKEVWHCPNDTGFDAWDSGFSPIPMPTHPSSYAAYGMSYYYRTELAVNHRTLSNLTGYDLLPGGGQHGPAEINVLFDPVGFWHGGPEEELYRYNTLMGDGHVVSLTRAGLQAAWNLQLDPPTP